MSLPAGINIYRDQNFNNVTTTNLYVNGSFVLNAAATMTLAGTVNITGALTISGTTIFNTDPILRRVDNTTSRSLIFRTGALNDWLLTLSSGGSVLALTQANAGVNANFTMGLGTGNLAITGGASATLGYTTPVTQTVATRGGYLYTGTLQNAVGATPQVVTGFAGTANFNGIADTAAGADVAAAQVITNTVVTANSVGMVSIRTQTVAANACFNIKSVVFGAGTITIVLNNGGSATSAAGGVCSISFVLFQNAA